MQFKQTLTIIIFSILFLTVGCQRRYAHRTNFQFAKSQKVKKTEHFNETRKTDKKSIHLNDNVVSNKTNKLESLHQSKTVSQQIEQELLKPRLNKTRKHKILAKKLNNQIAKSIDKTKITYQKYRPTKTIQNKSTKDKGIVYIIIVVIVVLLIIGIIKSILGPFLWSIIVLAALILLLGFLLGWW